MKSIIRNFTEAECSPESTLRTILLFGRNVSTYKFALADVLLNSTTKQHLTYKDLRDDFLRELYHHHNKNPNQYQAGSNALTIAFNDYAINKDWDKLVKVAERNIYNNVFDAFHNVGGSTVKEEFSLFEHDKRSKRIVLTDNLLQLLESQDIAKQLAKENQARWGVVEEAWRNKLTPNLLIHEKESNNIYSVGHLQERINLRSAVNVLLPYQHGRCFYCNRILDKNVDKEEKNFPEVDHVIPHSAFNRYMALQNINSNGIWNLVIACKDCNRGDSGKFDAPPDQLFYENLIERNVLFTQEHKHSLKNTILLSIGAANHQQVELRMNGFYSYFNILKGWRPKYIYHE